LKTLRNVVVAIVIFVAIKACFSLSSHMAINSTLDSGRSVESSRSTASQPREQIYSAPANQPNQHELLRMFVNEFVINNKSFSYPIKVNEQTYLTGRSIKDDDEGMFVVEDYRIITPATPTIGEVIDTAEETEKQVAKIFCESLQDRDHLFSGYSSVGIIQNIADANGNILFSVKVDKSQCS
jgi:hypothetical protein